MAKFDSYPDNSAPADADLLISTDVSDTSADASGTTKKLTVSTLLNSGLDATVAALTATGRLTVSSATPRVDLTETDQAADAGKWKIIAFNGEMYFQPTTDGGTAQATPLRLGRDGSVVIPTPTAVDHAVKVVAWDDTTGRYAVQGPNGVLEQGDTRWRDISSLLINGWTGRWMVRRQGNWLTFRTGYNASTNLNGEAATSATFFNPASLPAGMQWNAEATDVEGFMVWHRVSGAVLTNAYWLNSAWELPGFGTVNDHYTFPFGRNEITNSTDVDHGWPTSLPGTAV